MDNQIKILIACGSGIATSTIAADEIKVICAKHNIKPQIAKCSMTEIASYEDKVDIMFTTNNYNGPVSIPHMSVTGFITGINEDALKKQIIKKILEIINKNNNRR
ncbi:PTS sugar transporter subunit IIB [Pectinatus frisingensis]|uniref:PTS sugar transporter subunit IIB n=1 Tax=Pectinatus frisingensis TaxID=865 RepID=UPI0018C5C535|nr:PTS sugar transporter subunit IIB [Pectinatus frisingensis]